MRALAGLLAIPLLSVGATACGGTSKGASTAPQASPLGVVAIGDPVTVGSHAIPPEGYVKNDGDTDLDDHPGRRGPSQEDESMLAAYKHGSSRADRTAITALVKSYFAAAAAGDGQRACSMLHSIVIAGLPDAGLPAGPAHATGNSGAACAAYMSGLFKEIRRQLANDEVATMTVTEVRVQSNTGLAKLGFRNTPESEILLHREGRVWKVGALVDSELP